MPINPIEKKFFEWLQAQPTKSNSKVADIHNALKKLEPFVDAPANIKFEDIKMSCADGHTLRLRHYCNDKTTKPLIIFLPGNGFVYDLFEVNHTVISKIAAKSGLHAVMVDYRLAPEYPYPKALEDAREAVAFIFKNADRFHADKKKIILAGHSSGANLAAVITNMMRNHPDISIFHQCLISGAYDYTNSVHEYDEFALQDKLLSPEEIKFSFNSYSQPAQRKEPTCSPFWEKDLSGLPSTTIIVGEYDGGRSQSEAYAKKLIMAGNDVEKIILPGQTHGTILYRKALSDGIDPAYVAANALVRSVNKL